MDEQHIPIDINANKLQDWLFSRKHCSKNWQDNILKIREKINSGIQDMPANDELVNLLSGTHINYFHCLEIVDILKKTEADTKNFLGRYSSQRMKDWQDIIQLYQKDNIYLAEAAQILCRNIRYEIPGLKKQIQKLEQQQTEYQKKQKDLTRNEANVRSEYTNACKQLGVTGKSLKKELRQLPKELPKMYDRVAEEVKQVQPALELYNEFCTFVFGKEIEKRLKLLRFLIEKGNVTLYEYRYGEKPLSIEEPLIEDEVTEKDISDKEDTIDFGDFNTDQIQYDLDLNTVTSGTGDIDWGDSSNVEAKVEDIDFNIDLSEVDITVEDSGLEGGVAKGEEALTILDYPQTRNEILEDLSELEAFVNMRIIEMSNEEINTMSAMQFAEAPVIVQMQTLDSLKSLSRNLQKVIDKLEDQRTLHLHNIKHSPKYIDLLAESLQRKLKIAEKIAESNKQLALRIKEIKSEIEKTNPLLKLVIEKTTVLQKQIEEDISKKYKNRVVTIVGGVQNI